MPGFLTEMGPLGPSMGSIERCKTVGKWTQESATQWNHAPKISIQDRTTPDTDTKGQITAETDTHARATPKHTPARTAPHRLTRV